MVVLRPIPHHFVVWLLLAPVLLIEFLALDGLVRTMQLQDPQQVQRATAQIIEQRQTSAGVEVRYTFVVPESGARVSPRGLLQNIAWVPIETSVWQAAQVDDGQIAIVYLPEDPSFSQPIGRRGSALFDRAMLWMVFLIVDLAWIYESFIMVQNFWHAQADRERGHVVRRRFWRTKRRPHPLFG